jgi:hypothetical protein
LAKATEGRDLINGLRDPIVEHSAQARANAGATRSARRHDELADRLQGQAEGLGLANELETMHVGLGVDTVSARSAPEWRQESPALIEPQRPDAES